MTKVYKTASGKHINMEQLRLLNEREIAVGNMQTNARGDNILKNGEILQTRNELIKQFYKSKVR